VGGDHPAEPGWGIVLAAHWIWLGLLILSGLLVVGLGRHAAARIT
jgi:hypothetical protein